MNNGLAHYFSPARTLKSRGTTPQRQIMSPRTDNNVRSINVDKKNNNFMINFEDEDMKKDSPEPETRSKQPP